MLVLSTFLISADLFLSISFMGDMMALEDYENGI